VASLQGNHSTKYSAGYESISRRQKFKIHKHFYTRPGLLWIASFYVLQITALPYVLQSLKLCFYLPYFRPNYQLPVWYREFLVHVFHYSTIISTKKTMPLYSYTYCFCLENYVLAVVAFCLSFLAFISVSNNFDKS
jgi:hypothetical protein